MAQVKKGIYSLNVKASSLIEVTVALIIISMIFSMAIAIYLNVQRSGFSTRKLVYNVMLDEAYNQTIQSKEFENKDFDYDGVTLFRYVKRMAENENLVILRFEIRNADGQLLGERKYLLYAPG